MPEAFIKKPTTYAEQLEILKKRGMSVADDANALFYLEHLNYYRLGAYWLPFEANHASHQFKSGTTFEAVLDLYVFDRELRLHVLDAVERVEVSVRAHWAYEMSHRHGTHAHMDKGIALSTKFGAKNLNDIEKEVKRSNEQFIKHLTAKYSEPLPPVWGVSEVISLGLLSRCYSNLKPMATRSAIARAYHLDQAVLGSWLHHLSQIRNISAHHSRLWNREFKRTIMIPKGKTSTLRQELVLESRNVYNTLVVLLYLMDVICPEHTWRDRLRELLMTDSLHPHTGQLKAMGFPDGWEERTIWTGAL